MPKQNNLIPLTWKLIAGEALRLVRALIAGGAVLLVTFFLTVLLIQVQDMFFAGNFEAFLQRLPITNKDIVKIYAGLTLVIYAFSFKRIPKPGIVNLKTAILAPPGMGILVLVLFNLDGYDWTQVSGIIMFLTMVSITLNTLWISIGIVGKKYIS